MTWRNFSVVRDLLDDATISRLVEDAMTRQKLFNSFAGLFILVLAARVATGETGFSILHFRNDLGVSETLSTRPIDEQTAFFQSLGTHGRACVTCHQPNNGWTITPASVRKRFRDSDGLDPIFRTNDGATCPSADVSTVEARRSAYSMLLKKGLIRVALAIPANAEFSLVDVDDPYDC